MGKLRVGIAGYGTVGKRRKLCVEQNPHMKLIAPATCSQNLLMISEPGATYLKKNFYNGCR